MSARIGHKHNVHRGRGVALGLDGRVGSLDATQRRAASRRSLKPAARRAEHQIGAVDQYDKPLGYAYSELFEPITG